jgi:hypothetical protein
MGNECLAIPRSYTAFLFDRHLLAGLADGGIRRGATGESVPQQRIGTEIDSPPAPLTSCLASCQSPGRTGIAALLL